MPSRSYSAGTQFRYGFNGQEKSEEIATNTTTAKFWEYDSRIVMRWNIDPVLKVGESPYSCFSDNPVWRSDPNGDTDSTKNSATVEGPSTKTSSVNIRIGSTGGALFPWSQNGATSIFGNKTYYNSLLNDNSRTGTTFKPDEPNSFVQIQVKVGNVQIGLNWFKQKFRENSDGFGYEAPTAVHLSLGLNRNLTSIGKKINISSNFSFGAGPEVGIPRNVINTSITFDRKTLLGTNYSFIGVGASAIYRVDATYAKHWTLFVAGTIHHLRTFDQRPSSGSLNGETINSFAISTGIGVNIGGQHR